MATLIGEINWYRGDSYPMELTIKDKTTGDLIDITGYSFKLSVDTLEKPPDATTLLFEVPGILDVDPTTGKVSFTPTEANTDQVPATYFYDVQMIDASGNIRTIAKNKWKMKQDISK